MHRVHNFSAGPAALPEAVLDQIRADIPDWNGSGMSVMEVSHRGKDFVQLAAQAERDLRELLAIPDEYAVLFMQGGATLQFAVAPLNLSAAGDTADYVVTGSWGKKAAQEAGRFCKVNVAASSADSNFTNIPDPGSWQLTDGAAYLHYTPNETIGGVEFHTVPECGDVPLVA
ncbi:MAG: aminotransferase class V-fold PLP-dependent enzyme, partial [Gammaproteobacteria bacterium]|nr:aminotransferase class V-fold PLP-dependent enzyme [Gammaproteobacteria bacterium]